MSLVSEIASILDCTPADLLDPEPPTRRAALEIELRRLQEDPRNQERKLPFVRPSTRMADEVLEHIVGLYAAFNFLNKSLQVAGRRQVDVAKLTNGLKNLGATASDFERLQVAADNFGNSILELFLA